MTTRQEMAGGIIEYAEAHDITLSVDNDQLVIEYPGGHSPGIVIAELLRICRADIVDALKERARNTT